MNLLTILVVTWVLGLVGVVIGALFDKTWLFALGCGALTAFALLLTIVHIRKISLT